MRASDHIIAAVTQVRASAPPLDQFDQRIFRANLAFIYQVISASEQLLIECAELAEGELRAYLTAHLEEERGHAQWLAEDMGSTDFPRSRTAVAMAGGQYYLMKHVHPACLLGYMLVLECFPMPLEIVAELELAHGKQLLRTVRHHAEHDPEHGADLRAIVDRHYCPEILESAIETARYLNEFAQELQ